MEDSVKKIQFGWAVLRCIAGSVEFFTFAILVAITPTQLELLRALAIVIGILVSVLVAFKCSLVWVRVALILKTSFFIAPMEAAVFASNISNILPVLLLAFVMILFSEHAVSLVSEFSHQFSVLRGEMWLDFNTSALGRSLIGVYRRLARNGVVFASSYVLAIGILLSGFSFNRFVPFLSDVSLYALVVSVSVALLVVVKED